MRVIQAYRFALDPTGAQEQALRSHCWAQRFAYNWGLSRVKANLAQREAERSYGISDQELTPPVSWSAWSLRKEFNQAKDSVASWWPENSKECYASGLANLAQALVNWRASRDGSRNGPRITGRDLNAARNLAALAGGASSPSRGATENEPAGNPGKTRTAGTGYRHGKTTPASGGGQRPRRKAQAA